MTRFKINDKEYELKLTYQSLKYLNKLYGADQGGALQFVAKAMQGDLETFPHIIHAALFHTEENFSFKTVEKAVEEATVNGELDYGDILRLSNELVTDSFFYRTTADMLVGKKAVDNLLKDIRKKETTED